jgi:signal transduction histidine kinase
LAGNSDVGGAIRSELTAPICRVKNDLAESFQRAAEVLQITGSREFVLSVEGTVRGLHPIVRDEVYRIGSEVIRSAYLHSDGNRLELKIVYGHDLIIKLRDNGTGEDPYLPMASLQERAARIGGQIRSLRGTVAGTDIVLRVSGRAAYYERISPLNI